MSDGMDPGQWGFESYSRTEIDSWELKERIRRLEARLAVWKRRALKAEGKKR